MDYSFYGGRRGASFVIAKAFTSIDEMIAAFSQGDAYLEVNYDEYVIIDIPNKNDLDENGKNDNGKIFRRGYDLNNNLGGALYVGQIVGPTGKATIMEMDSYYKVTHPLIPLDSEIKQKQGTLNIKENGDLLPGKNEDGTFNDEIKWAYFSFRKNDGTESKTLIGFQFPYHILELSANWISPYKYDEKGELISLTSEDLIQQVDDKTHPFYSKWNISIPKGVKGDALKNFRIVSSAEDINALEAYEGKEEDAAGKISPSINDADRTRHVLAYDYVDYSKSEQGETKSLYLGDYNIISKISLDEKGAVHVAYTHDEDFVSEDKITWITGITLTQQGVFTIHYNNKDDYITNLTWIDTVDFKDDGTVTFQYNNHTTENPHQNIFTNKIQWVTGATLSPEGTLTFTYNNGAKPTIFEKIIKWITGITVAPDGTLSIEYNNGSEASVFSKVFKWIENVTLQPDGTLSFEYNNGSASNIFSKAIKWITNLKINTGETEGTGNQKLHVTYNDGTEEDIGNAINYVMKTAITPKEHDLLVWYSDPAKRANGIEFNGESGWVKVGNVKGNEGILVGASFLPEFFGGNTAHDNVINILNREFPNGLEGSKQEGRVALVGAPEDIKDFYAFDYEDIKGTYRGWFYVGSLTDPTGKAGYPGAFASTATENGIPTNGNAEKMPTDSLWFVIEETKAKEL